MSEDLVISDVNGICRLCLKGDGTIIPIFGRENTSRDCIPLSKKIFNCVSVEVINGDGMSNMICVGCVHQVDSWNGFKNTCESSQKKLMQWLHKNKPDVFERNEAKRHARFARIVQVNGNSSAVIDLSSDDEEFNLTLNPIQVANHRLRFDNRPFNKPADTTAQKFCSTVPSSRSKNIEVMPLTTNEIEIFPVSNAVCDATNVNNDTEIENASLPEVTNIDRLNKEPESVESSSNSQILPDVDALPETSENLIIDSAQDSHPGEESASNDLTTEVIPDSHDYVLDNPPVNNDTITSAENESIDCIINVNLRDFEVIEEQPNKSNGKSVIDATVSRVIDDEQSDPLAEKEISSSTKVGERLNDEENSNLALNQTSLARKENSDHGPLALKDKSESFHNQETSEKVIIETEGCLEKNHSVHGSGCVNSSSSNVAGSSHEDEQTDRTESVARLDDNSTFMIGEVTSLSNTEMPDGETEPAGNLTNDDLIDDYVDESAQDERGVWSSQEESTSDVQPDIIMCDSPMMNVKEEPLSASEDVDEDPLDFQTIMIKNEIDNSQFVSELEDVKPNIGQLSEIFSNQYAPKRLKCGKPYCEPCRVSYSTDVSYQRHTLSLRHKLNFKLFKSGKGPTKIGSRSLKSALMGNINDVPLAARSQGPYRCNYCPSAFKHLRNLKTHHQKIHLHGYVRRGRPAAPAPLHNESNDVNSKPPVRQSARNLSFAEIPETQCELCNHTFSGMQGLISHKRYCGLSGSHVCIHCEKAFSTAALLLRHKRECESNMLSPKSFLPSNQNPSLNLDPPSKAPLPSSAAADGPVVACTLCNLNFHSSTDLIAHMQQNHMDFGKPPSPAEVPNFAKPNQYSGIRDSSLHYCRYCPRSFPTYGALSSHTGYHARKSAYFCKFCRQNHRDKVSFRQHMRVHISDPSNKNVCWICYTPFNSQGDLLNHKKNHAMKSTVFPCSFCGNSYNSKELLVKHKRAEHVVSQPPDLVSDSVYDSAEHNRGAEKQVQIIDEDYKLFKCKICKKKFSNLANLKRHAKAHKYGQNPVAEHGEHSSYHRCANCFKAFRTQSGLLNHRPLCSRMKATNAPGVVGAIPGNPVKCKGCKKWFASKNTLYKHAAMGRCLGEKEQPRTETVSAIRPKSCPNCDQEFLSEETLSRHKQSCKPTIDRLTCDCGEVFASVDVKLEHAETCSANCTCKSCNLKFNSPEELESHQMVCSSEQAAPPVENNLPENQQLECYKCNKRFVYSKCLQMHLEKCMYNRWPCSSCQELFPSESALALHRKTSCLKLGKSPGTTSQDSVSPVKCEYCHMQFSSQNDLIQHTFNCQKRSVGAADRTTSDYRPFSCEYCGKTFIWKANMYRHLKLAHLNRMNKSSENTETKRASSPLTAYKTTLPTDKVTNLFNSDKLSVFRCKLCPDIVFHKQQGFLEHQMIHKQQGFKEPDSTCNAENMLTCELCDRKLPESLYPMHMDEHMNDDFEESNTNQRPVTSVKDAGGEPSNNESSPETSHETSKGYPCDLCGKTFSNPSSRKSHRAHHFRAGQGFTSPKKLLQNKKHIRCKICNKLLSVNSIHKHNMMHARDDAEFYGGSKDVSAISLRSTSEQVKQEQKLPEESFSENQCPKCDQSFGTRVLLISHMKDHADDCLETGSTSSGVGSVDQHPYKCVYCDLSWKYKSVYERHLLSKKHLEVQNQLSGIVLQ